MAVDYFHIQFLPDLNLLVSMAHVLEIITLTPVDICPIPGMRSELLGVVNYRGSLLWIVDLGELWGLNRTGGNRRATDKLTLVVMTTQLPRSSGYQWGAVIQQLQGIVTLPEQNTIATVPADWPAQMVPFVAATTEFEQKPMAFLDVMALFDSLQASVQPTSMV